MTSFTQRPWMPGSTFMLNDDLQTGPGGRDQTGCERSGHNFVSISTSRFVPPKNCRHLATTSGQGVLSSLTRSLSLHSSFNRVSDFPPRCYISAAVTFRECHFGPRRWVSWAKATVLILRCRPCQLGLSVSVISALPLGSSPLGPSLRLSPLSGACFARHQGHWLHGRRVNPADLLARLASVSRESRGRDPESAWTRGSACPCRRQDSDESVRDERYGTTRV